MASCSIPYITGTTILNGDHYVDGGMWSTSQCLMSVLDNILYDKEV